MKNVGFYISYAIIWVLTLLPFKALYIFSDFAFLIVYYVIGYRKKVVIDNLRHAFPEKSEQEILVLSKKFFHHFCDFLIEFAKIIHLSAGQIDKRVSYVNPELLIDYYNRNKSVVLVLPHYANWEWAANCANKIKLKPIAIYKPLRNKKFDNLILSLRKKWNMQAAPMNDVIRVILSHEKEKIRIVTSYLVDQTPPRRYPFWINFFNRGTPFYTGPAKIAKKFGQPIVYMKMTKIKRGYYQVEFYPLFDEPDRYTEEEIINRIVKEIENHVREKPEYWLWSHRRWKHTKENYTSTNN